MNPRFDHEKLMVYQFSLKFISLSTELVAQIQVRAAVKDQLDRASTSVPLNIAEGNGKFAIRDRCRFIEIARGSALECAACLDVLVAKSLCNETRGLRRKSEIDRNSFNADGITQQSHGPREGRVLGLFEFSGARARARVRERGH